MSPFRKHLASVTLLCGALLAVVGTPAATAAPAAGVPCWKQLLNDWYDGTINNIYPLPCYRQAIDHLPLDVQAYSSAKDDILAAEQAAANHQHAPKEKSPPPGATTTTGGSSGSTTTPPTATTTTPTTTTPDANPPKKKGGFAGVLADLTPGNPQSFPLPLLVLGALAILLVLAGGFGMIWQRTHPRGDDAQ